MSIVLTNDGDFFVLFEDPEENGSNRESKGDKVPIALGSNAEEFADDLFDNDGHSYAQDIIFGGPNVKIVLPYHSHNEIKEALIMKQREDSQIGEILAEQAREEH